MDGVQNINNKDKFLFIGDIHGCYRHLLNLFRHLGYVDNQAAQSDIALPEDRMLVFLGDLTDRGDDPVSVLRLVMKAVEAGQAVCLRGNHDEKLYKALIGKKVNISPDLQRTLQAIAEEGDEFKSQVTGFLESLPYQVVLEDGKIVAAHGGMKEEYHGRDSSGMRAFALYGGPTGQVDEFGHPVRENWAAAYQGQAYVIYGHTPVSDIVWVNRTINIDSGCFQSGILTALKWPEKEIVQSCL